MHNKIVKAAGRSNYSDALCGQRENLGLSTSTGSVSRRQHKEKKGKGGSERAALATVAASR